ncbi:hypothetical protein HK102_005301, partial [Quaeritorhiza haematococci]
SRFNTALFLQALQPRLVRYGKITVTNEKKYVDPWDRHVRLGGGRTDITLTLREAYKNAKRQVRSKFRWQRRKILIGLQTKLLREVGPLVPPPGVPFALVDFPDHSNVGDHAIWLGEHAFFEAVGRGKVRGESGRRRKGKGKGSGAGDQDVLRPVFTCTAYIRSKYRYTDHDCDFNTLRKLLGSDPRATIFSHGGGNIRNMPGKDRLGFFQFFRHKLVESFPNNPIVIMPQSINFEEKAPNALKESVQVWGGHGNLTVLVRDKVSEAFARRYFGRARTVLSLDMAFMIGPVGSEWEGMEYDMETGTSIESEGKGKPPYLAVWINRVDKESQFRVKGNKNNNNNNNTPFIDPAADLPIPDSLKPHILVTDWKFIRYDRNESFTLLDRAQTRVQAGLDILSQGQVVITDRLHALILGLLLGKPVIVMDNDYGKVGRFWGAFLKGVPGIYWARSREEAVGMVGPVVESYYESVG